MARTLSKLLDALPQVGRLEWIGLRPAHRAAIEVVHEVQAIADHGLAGDRTAERPGGKRQVTLIQSEHLPAIAAMSGRGGVAPAWLRRNLVVSGINLLALKKRQFSIGHVMLEHTGPCEPCSYMEEVLGPGGYNAMRGHGGITAVVLTDGVLRVGDPVRLIAGNG
jgi:MOSC domain-containing protein YiiM